MRHSKLSQQSVISSPMSPPAPLTAAGSLGAAVVGYAGPGRAGAAAVGSIVAASCLAAVSDRRADGVGAASLAGWKNCISLQ